MNNTKAIAEEATSNYLSSIRVDERHAKNVSNHLRPIVEQLTRDLLRKEEESLISTKLKEAVEHKNRTSYCRGISDDEEFDNDGSILSQSRTNARMEAFLKECTLAIPKEPNAIPATKEIEDKNESFSLLSLSTGLVGLNSNEEKSTKIKYQYPQFYYNDLCIRLDLYCKSLIRVAATGEDCVIQYESPKLLKARTDCLLRSLFSNTSCTSSTRPVLLHLLSLLTMEVLAMKVLGDELQHAMERICTDYEHQISFASFAFLSSQEHSAAFHLAPTLLSYLQYLQVNHERLVATCLNEAMLRLTIPTHLRNIFKHSEFESIGHVLNTCHTHSKELAHLVLPPLPQNTLKELIRDEKAVTQALKDLQREVIMVNGFILPPVQSYKELVSWLGDLLNSRKRSSTDCFDGDLDEISKEKNGTTFDYKTIDKMTCRLLLSSCRTRTGGDAYFVVQDLFGGDDAIVVQSSEPHPQPLKKSKKRCSGRNRCTIEILVRLSSVLIKCYAKYDVYPKHNDNNVEPLIQLDTTTSETISLQAVRVCDANSSDEDGGLGVVLREKKTDVTGRRVLSIRPAKYYKVAVWNTPS